VGARDDKFLALRRALAVALLLGVASVGVGSAPGALRRPNPSTAFFVGQTLTTVLLVMTSVLGAAVVWVAAQGTRRRRPRDDEPPPVPVRAGLSPTPLLLVVGLMALVGTWLVRWLPTASPSSTPAAPHPPAPAPTPSWTTGGGDLPSAANPGTSWTWPVWVLALLLVAAGAFALVAARRPTGRPAAAGALEGPPAGDASPAARTAAPPPPPPVTTSPAGSPREAVITAYGTASDAMCRRGLARHPAETPDEYAERVRREVPGVGRAAEDLTAGYQRVRFSDAAAEPADARAAWSAAQRVLDALGFRS
jgi:hypothetical protein